MPWKTYQIHDLEVTVPWYERKHNESDYEIHNIFASEEKSMYILLLEYWIILFLKHKYCIVPLKFLMLELLQKSLTSTTHDIYVISLDYNKGKSI